MRTHQEYTLQILDKRTNDRLAERRYMPIISGDDRDVKSASLWWVVGGVAGMVVELGIAFNFFVNTLRVPLWASVSLSCGLVVLTAIGVKMWLENSYADARRRATDLRDAEDEHNNNFLAWATKENAYRASREAHHGLRQAITQLGFGAALVGGILLAIERTQLDRGDGDTLSVFAYIWNSAIVVAGALLAGVSFHHFHKKNEEVERIVAINEEVRQIEEARVDLLRLREESNVQSHKVVPLEVGRAVAARLDSENVTGAGGHRD
jgi:hypothetical protein